MDEWGTRTLLRDLAASEPPASRVDVEAAITGAERRRRRRAGALVAGVAALVAGVIAVVALPAMRTPPSPVASVPPPAQQQSKSAPYRLDPTHFQLRLGWRPPGVAEVRSESDGGYQMITLIGPDDSKGVPRSTPIAVLQVAGEGQVEPEVNAGAEKAPAVYANGAASHWISNGTRGGRLLWFWAPGAWAFLTISDQPHPLDLAVRLARELRTNEDTAVRMPFSIQAPAGLKLIHTSVTRASGGKYEAEARFGLPADGWVPNRWVRVVASNSQTVVLVLRPNATIDGRPAVVSGPTASAAWVEVHPTGRDTIAVRVETRNGPVPLDLAGTLRLARATKLVDQPEKEGNWVSPFLR